MDLSIYILENWHVFDQLHKRTHASLFLLDIPVFYKQLPGFECNLVLLTQLTHDCCRKRLVEMVFVTVHNLLHVTFCQYVSVKGLLELPPEAEM